LPKRAKTSYRAFFRLYESIAWIDPKDHFLKAPGRGFQRARSGSAAAFNAAAKIFKASSTLGSSFGNLREVVVL